MLRPVIDIFMTIILLIQMSYELFGTSLAEIFHFDGYEYSSMIHEVLGIILIILFFIHLWLNRWWLKNLFKGKYTFSRIILTVMNFALIFDVITLLVSGLAMAKSIEYFHSENYMSLAREFHMLAAYWGFVIMSVHAGWNWQILRGMLLRKFVILNNNVIKKIFSIIVIIIMIYGVKAFHERGLLEYMTLSSIFVFFDFEENIMYFFADYAAIMILFECVGNYINLLLRRLEG